MNLTRIALLLNFLLAPMLGFGASEYRIPDNPDIVRLLTANQVPEVLFNAHSGRIVFIHQETLVPVERIARRHLGLAGYWIDPKIRASGYDSRVEYVEVVDSESGETLARWEPEGEAALDHVDISPDGRYLSAVSFREDLPRLALFEIATGREQLVSAAVNPAFEAPCTWIQPQELLCRLIPDEKAVVPAPFASPNIMDHPGGKARTRTYGNLLSSAYDELLFEYYFSSTLARVSLDGKVHRLEATTGLLARVEPSPDHRYALIARLQRPYSHLLKASHFPRQFELWNLETGKQINSPSLPQQGGITATRGTPFRKFSWRLDSGALGWVERPKDAAKRWVALDPPYTGEPREVASSEAGIADFGWTDQGTPYFSQLTNLGTEISVFIVALDREPKLVWN